MPPPDQAAPTPTQQRFAAGQAYLQSIALQGQARVLQGIQALAHLEQTLVASPLKRPLPFIVSQADLTQKQIDQWNTFVPTTIRLGLLGAIVMVMWWTWPSTQLPPGLWRNSTRRPAIKRCAPVVGNCQPSRVSAGGD
ncbi:MAG: hypothetical protein R3E79_18390 [Caldilineaceae bacterium]